MELNQPSYLTISKLLSTEEVQHVNRITENAQFQDGKLSASDSASQVKQNLQIRAEDNMHAQQAGNIIMQAISRNALLQSAIMPKAMLPPLISKYQEGMNYGMHVDSPLMGSQYTIRTDVGMTLFLTEPDSYEGGELLILTETGEQYYKLAAGDAIVYPTTKLHQVMPVTSGVRLAAVTWMQCVVRNSDNRDLLFKLNQTIAAINQSGLTAEKLSLQQIYSNLVRQWAEL